MAAGDAALSLVLNITAVDGASAIIGGLARTLTELAGGGVMGAVAVAGIAAGAAVVGMGAAAAKSAGDFQTLMNQLVTSAGESQSNLKAVSDGVLKISTDTGTATDQLAKGMYFIESSGQHGAAGLDVLRVAAMGAKAENADLTTVSKALTTVLTDYHLPVNDATAAMNGLIATVQNGKTNLTDLSKSMGNVLPIASAMGISFPQVAGAMDTMTNAGMSSQRAAQNLAHVLVALEAPSGVATKSMQAVGLSAQQVKDALVSQGLPQALQLIEEHVGKTFPAGSVEAETALKNIMGGLVGLKTAAMLTGDSLNATEANIKKITAAMNDASTGVLGWDLVQTSFNFKLDQAKAAFSAMMITLGTELLPIFGKIVGWVTQAVEAFTAWENKTHTVQNALNALVNGIQGVIDFLSKLGAIISDALTGNFDQLQKDAGVWGANLITAFVNGIISSIGEVATVAGQVAQTIADSIGFKSPTKKGPGSQAHLWGPALVKTLASGMIASIPVIDNAANTVAGRLAAVLGGQGQGLTLAKGLAAQGTQGTASNLNSVMPAVTAANAATNTVCKTATAASSCASHALTTGLAAKVKATAHHVAAAANHVGAQTHAAATHAATAAGNAHKALTTGLASKVKASAPAVAGAVASLADSIKQGLAPVHDTAAKAGNALAPMGTAIQKTWQQVMAAMKPVGDFIKTTFDPLWKTMADTWNQILKPAWNALVGAFKDALPSLRLVYGAVGGLIIVGLEIFLKGLVWVLQVLVVVLGYVAAGVLYLITAWLKLVSTVKPVWEWLKQASSDTAAWVQSAWKKMLDWFAGAWTNIKNAPGVAWDWIKKAVSDVTAWVGQKWNDAVKTVVGWFQWMYDHNYYWQNTVDFIKTATSTVTAWLKQAWTTSITWLGDQWKTLSTAATTTWNTIADIFSKAWDRVAAILANDWSRFSAWWTDTSAKSQKASDAMWKSVSDTFNSAWSKYISGPLATLTGNIGKWFTDRGNEFKTWGGNLMKMFGDGITAGFHWALDAITKLGQQIYTLLGFHSPPSAGPLASSGQWMPNMMKMLGDGITAGIPGVMAPITSLATQMQAKMSALATSVGSTVQNINTQVQQAITGAQSGASTAQGAANAAQGSAATSQGAAARSQGAANAAQGASVGSASFSVAAQGAASTAQGAVSVAQGAAGGAADFGTAATTFSVNAGNAAVQAGLNAEDSGRMQSRAAALANQAASASTQAGLNAEDAGRMSDRAAAQAGASRAAAGDSQGSASLAQQAASLAFTQAIVAGKSLSQANDAAKQAGTAAVRAQQEFNNAQALANQAAALVGHSKPREGPLKDDDKWGEHFIDNIADGMRRSKHKISDAVEDAAEALAKLHGGGGGTSGGGILGKWIVDTGLGNIPIAFQLPANQQNQPIVVHNYTVLDGKVIDKKVSTCIGRELRVQGGIRGA